MGLRHDKIGKNVKTISIRAGMMVVFVAAFTLVASGLVQYIFTQRAVKEEASLRAESELDGAHSDIMDVVNQAEAAVRNSLWIAQWCMERLDSLHRVPQRIVMDNPGVVGSTIALVPGYNNNRLGAPYALRDLISGEIITISLATEEYDYPSQEWFTAALMEPDGHWSEPYFDDGGGDILMTTFSMPVKDVKGEIAAVLTADISLEWLSELVGDIKMYPRAMSTIVSRAGNTLVVSGEEPASGEKCQVYSIPVERTGWTLNIMLPEKELYSNVRKVELVVRLFQLLGLLMLILILRVVANNLLNLQKLNEQKERMQSELRIGREIQMSMVPNTFPPFPDRTDLDFAAYLNPAKEVGGDLYDYYIRDNKLYFCIGDVSGKGVPASLLMTVTRTLFRAVSSHESSPGRIVEAMNKSMTETDSAEMFVTFFCAVLDLSSGLLTYCNAGHNPPLLITNEIKFLPEEPNIPLAVVPEFSYKEQQISLQYDDAIFLYTDGLTEAENASAEQFGEERMIHVLHTRRSSQDQLKAMEAAVADFVQDAPQSDDLTMLFIHFMAHVESNQKERRLILHNDIQQIPQLADFLETIAYEMNLEQSLVLSLNLALEEAVTNVILYAYPKGADGLVDIEAIMKEKSLEFIISDSGTPFDPTAAPTADVSLSAEDRPIGGLGIFLVRQIMDDVRYERVDGKNRLLITKAL